MEIESDNQKNQDYKEMIQQRVLNYKSSFIHKYDNET